jgi:hypothetical protein
MTSDEAAASLDATINRLAAAAAHLTPADWRRLRVFQPRLYEQIRHQLDESDRRLIAQLARHVAEGQLPIRNVEQYLIETLHLTPEDARTRLRTALDELPDERLAG